MSILLFILGIILFIGLVVVHEFGHFIVARRNGVKVEEFGIFFPPRLFRYKTKAGWDFTINLLPLGGFVRLKGEHDSDTAKGTFGAASLGVKSKIMAAGVVMNLVTALVMFTIIALIGMPKIVDNQYTIKSDTKTVKQEILVGTVEKGSPADKAGLKPQDNLVEFVRPGYSPVAAQSSAHLRTVTKNFAGQSVVLHYTRAGHKHEARTTFQTKEAVAASIKAGNPKGYLGVSTNDFQLNRSTWSAPVVAVGLSAQLTTLTFQGLGHALGGLGSLIAGGATGNTSARQHGQAAASENVSGPVGIFKILQGGSVLGYQFTLFIIAYISLTLAIMNILPIPALDGGRLWITLIARGLKRPLSQKREELINAIGFVTLITLVILISIVDVKRFF